MNTEEVALKLVSLCREGKWMDAVNALYGDNIVSVEPRAMGDMPAEMKGLEAVRGKTEWFTNAHEVHSCTVTGPYVARDTFVVQFDIDVTDKASGERMQMGEVGVYTAKDGKVVREEFLPLAASKS
jgi:ketosteroid isomerase-like protein